MEIKRVKYQASASFNIENTIEDAIFLESSSLICIAIFQSVFPPVLPCWRCFFLILFKMWYRWSFSTGKLINFRAVTVPSDCITEQVASVLIPRSTANIKTVTSRMVRKEHSAWMSKFYWKPIFWSRSYYIGTIGEATIEIVERYIQNQRVLRPPIST